MNYYLLASSPLNLGCTLQLLHNAGVIPTVVTSKPINETVDKTVELKVTDIGKIITYNIRMLPRENACSLKDRYSDFKEKEIWGYGISMESFRDLLSDEEEDLAIFSACRDHLISTYEPLLAAFKGRGTVITLDNNKSYAETLREDLLKIPGNNLRVFPAVAHHKCVKISEDESKIVIGTEGEPRLYFPPGLDDLHHSLNETSSKISYTETHMRFYKTVEEFSNVIAAKAVYINVPHTIAALIVYAANEMASSSNTFQEYRDLFEEVFYCCEVLEEVCNIDIPDYEKDVWQTNRERFLTHIFSDPNECLQRALSFDRNGLEKLEEHWKFIGRMKEDQISKLQRGKQVFFNKF